MLCRIPPYGILVVSAYLISKLNEPGSVEFDQAKPGASSGTRTLQRVVVEWVLQRVVVEWVLPRGVVRGLK